MREVDRSFRAIPKNHSGVTVRLAAQTEEEQPQINADQHGSERIPISKEQIPKKAAARRFSSLEFGCWMLGFF
jgi:hypothetical protein